MKLISTVFTGLFTAIALAQSIPLTIETPYVLLGSHHEFNLISFQLEMSSFNVLLSTLPGLVAKVSVEVSLTGSIFVYLIIQCTIKAPYTLVGISICWYLPFPILFQ